MWKSALHFSSFLIPAHLPRAATDAGASVPEGSAFGCGSQSDPRGAAAAVKSAKRILPEAEPQAAKRRALRTAAPVPLTRKGDTGGSFHQKSNIKSPA